MLAMIRLLLSRFGGPGLLVLGGRLSFLLLFLIAARTSSPVQFGLFVVSVAASQILAVVCSLGTGPAAQLVISEAYGLRRPGRALGYVRFSILVTAAVTLAAVLLLWLLGLAANALLPASDVGQICYAMAWLLPGMAASSLREYTARAAERIVLAFAPRDIFWTAGMSAALLLFPAARDHPVIAAAILLLAVESVAWFLLWHRHLHPAGAGSPSMRLRPYRRWRERSLAMMSSFIAGLGFDRIDVMLIGLLASLPVAGLYGAAGRAASLLSISQRFIVPVITPRITRCLAARDMAGVRKEVRSGVWGSLPFAIPLALGVLVFAPEIMGLYGESFVAGANILRILAMAHLAVAICSSFGTVVMMGPQPWQYTRIIWMALVPASALLLIVVPLAGPLGAAMVTASGIIFYNLHLVRAANRICAMIDPGKQQKQAL